MARVLVIDDDQSVRLAIEALLRHQEFAVVLANSGQLGSNILETTRFDVVMVDIFMPGMDGLETIKAFRKRAPTTPIVAMSGFRFCSSHMVAAPDFLGMAIKLGAAYCLRKPFRPEQLMTAINACLAESRSVLEPRERDTGTNG